MGRNQQQVIDAFLTAYTKNDAAALRGTLAEDIAINYSTIGAYQGVDAVCTVLAWKENYDVRTVTVTNVMSYPEGASTVYGLIAHHMVANETGSQLYPLCFGGKYVFTVGADGLIHSVAYAQEYQVENTFYIRGWNLAARISDLSAVKGFDLEKAYASALAKEDPAQVAAALSYIFLWAVDKQDLSFIAKLASNDLHIVRSKTMSYGKFEADSLSNLGQFIADSKAYYSMDQYSISVNSVQVEGNTITVNTSHLIPYRLGTKKLHTGTKYRSFFDEDIVFTYTYSNGTYCLRDVTMKKIADVRDNGFDILHL